MKDGESGATIRSETGQESLDIFRRMAVRAAKSSNKDWEKTNGKNNEPKDSNKKGLS